MKKGIWISLGGIALLAIGISSFHIGRLNKSASEESAITFQQVEENKDEKVVDEVVSGRVYEEPQIVDETSQKPEENAAVVDKVYEEPQPKEEQKETIDVATLSNEKKGWWFRRNAEHLPPTAQEEINLKKYNAYYLGNTEEKVIYLTFDEGYENGFTPAILDTLKANDVQAAFFVTKPYVKSEPELVKRMIEEGHVVGNHSVTHPSLPDKTDEEVDFEINELSRYYKEITGKDIDLFFRPPMGEYSERTLQLTKNYGYKTIFWSMAHRDWLVDDQPGKEAAYQHVMDNYHPGAIILLHAVSQSNTEALDQILKDLKKEGYRFASLYELP